MSPLSILGSHLDGSKGIEMVKTHNIMGSGRRLSKDWIFHQVYGTEYLKVGEKEEATARASREIHSPNKAPERLEN